MHLMNSIMMIRKMMATTLLFITTQLVTIAQVEKEIEKYRDILLNTLHPAGLKLLGRYALKCNTQFFNTYSATSTIEGKELKAYTGDSASHAVMYADFNNKSNNIVKLTNIAYTAFLSNTPVKSGYARNHTTKQEIGRAHV